MGILDDVGDRLSHAWNAFKYNDNYRYEASGPVTSYRPDREYVYSYGSQTIISSIYTRIAIDVASLNFVHAKMTEDGSIYKETMDSGLNNCLSVEANIDQSYFDFMLDVVISLLDEGVIAVVPSTDLNPNQTGSYDVKSLRTGKILAWSPTAVQVRLYNEETGLFEDVYVAKKYTAIIENPFHAVMNDSNSTVKRLARKLVLIDKSDEQSASGKLDMIIQLPYAVKTKAREEQAARRKESIEMQLTGSKYGIAYIDATEKITQLNRPVTNNLVESAEALTKQLYNQLGMSEAVFDGTADEQTLLNYYNQTILPIATAICSEMTRKFLTKTARTQKQAIMFLRDPFKLVPVGQLADIADKFTRNTIMTPNEFRPKVGLRPSSDPEADELRNRNMPREDDGSIAMAPDGEEPSNSEVTPGSFEDLINSL